MEPTTSDRHGAARPTIAGVVCAVVGALALVGAAVGYTLADGRLSTGDRLAEARSFGLPTTVVALAGLILLVVGLVLLGVGIGTAREHHGHGGHGGHGHHALH